MRRVQNCWYPENIKGVEYQKIAESKELSNCKKKFQIGLRTGEEEIDRKDMTNRAPSTRLLGRVSRK